MAAGRASLASESRLARLNVSSIGSVSGVGRVGSTRRPRTAPVWEIELRTHTHEHPNARSLISKDAARERASLRAREDGPITTAGAGTKLFDNGAVLR